MLTKKRAYPGAVIKKLHCKEVFKAANSFPQKELPTNRQVLEQMLVFPDFRTPSAAREVVHSRKTALRLSSLN